MTWTIWWFSQQIFDHHDKVIIISRLFELRSNKITHWRTGFNTFLLKRPLNTQIMLKLEKYGVKLNLFETR